MPDVSQFESDLSDSLKKSLSRKWWEDQQQQGGCGIGATKLVPVPVAETRTGEEEENEI